MESKAKSKFSFMKGFDYPLLLVVLGLCALGFAIVYSGSVNVAMAKGSSAAGEYLFRHLIYLLAGFGLLFFGSMFDHSVWKKFSHLCFGGGVLLLFLVFLMGKEVNGAQRWLEIGGVQIQPSEMVKFSVAVWISAKFSILKMPIADWKDYGIKMAQCFGVMLIIVFFLIKQPNYSMLLMICIVCFAVMVVAEIPWKYLMGSVGIVGVPLLIVGLFQRYRVERIVSFLNPEENAQGSAYQVINMMTAIGNGGIFGKGIGKGTQKLGFVPEVNTDGVFALIGEELGYLGSAGILLAFAFLFYRGALIAERARSNFARYLSVFIIGYLAMNTLIHIAVCLGCAPPTGQPLPFISVGGSNLCMNLFMIGVLLNISRENTGKSIAFDGVNSRYSIQKARYQGG